MRWIVRRSSSAQSGCYPSYAAVSRAFLHGVQNHEVAERIDVRRFYVRRFCVLSFSDEDGVEAEEGSDTFDVDSDFATPGTRSRKRSSMVERESFSELPELPEDLSKPVLTPASRTRRRLRALSVLLTTFTLCAVTDGADDHPDQTDVAGET